jgi:hypothetical protein
MPDKIAQKRYVVAQNFTSPPVTEVLCVRDSATLAMAFVNKRDRRTGEPAPEWIRHDGHGTIWETSDHRYTVSEVPYTPDDYSDEDALLDLHYVLQAARKTLPDVVVTKSGEGLTMEINPGLHPTRKMYITVTTHREET